MNVCTPPRGDIGKLLVALFLLLCGDELQNEDCTTFSVCLEALLSNFLGGKEQDHNQTDDDVTMKERNCKKETATNEDTTTMADGPTVKRKVPVVKPTVSFTQFCHNDLRNLKGSLS